MQVFKLWCFLMLRRLFVWVIFKNFHKQTHKCHIFALLLQLRQYNFKYAFFKNQWFECVRDKNPICQQECFEGCVGHLTVVSDLSQLRKCWLKPGGSVGPSGALRSERGKTERDSVGRKANWQGEASGYSVHSAQTPSRPNREAAVSRSG